MAKPTPPADPRIAELVALAETESAGQLSGEDHQRLGNLRAELAGELAGDGTGTALPPVGRTTAPRQTAGTGEPMTPIDTSPAGDVAQE